MQQQHWTTSYQTQRTLERKQKKEMKRTKAKTVSKRKNRIEFIKKNEKLMGMKFLVPLIV